jgi:hypothetical protein
MTNKPFLPDTKPSRQEAQSSIQGKGPSPILSANLQENWYDRDSLELFKAAQRLRLAREYQNHQELQRAIGDFNRYATTSGVTVRLDIVGHTYRSRSFTSPKR